MKLRTFAVASTATLAAISILTAGSLMLGTSTMDREVLHISATLENVRAIEKLQSQLLTHERERAMFTMTQRAEHARGRDRAEAEINRWLADLRRRRRAQGEELFRDGDEDALVLEAAEGELVQYLATSRDIEGDTVSPIETYTSLNGEVEEAYAALERLLAVELERANSARARAGALTTRADELGIAVSAALLLVVFLLRWMAGRQVYRPLLSLRGAMDRYAAGAHDARAPQGGLDELREIAVAFNGMIASLEEQRQQQLGMLASVAHDLKNPLAALKLTVDHVRPDRPLPPEERLRPMLARVGKQVARCDRMVGELLQTARMASGDIELQYEVRDARELVRDVVELYRPAATDHQLDASLPGELVSLCCDPLRIEQVLNNLVSNAIKYSPGGGAVRVAVAPDGGDVLLSVSDEGVGIAPEDHGRLFDRYARAASSRDVAPGAGLGLWAVRRIVEAHGGRVSVRSAPGEGATFVVRLPSSPAAARREAGGDR
jgi:signal transduction histidine kinase